jgi:hypothetical protein
MHHAHSRLTKLVVLSICLAASPVAFAQTADSILSRHIKEGDNLGQDTNNGSGIKTGHINNGAVTNAKLAAGAVTSDKITGPLPASLVNPSGLNADLLDGNHASAFAAAVHTHAQYRARNSKVLVVAADGSGDYTSLAAAMAAITDASSANPYLIKIGPGDFQVAPNWQAKSYVDIEGSGQGITRIWAACPALTIGATVVNFSGVVGSEVRDVTIQMMSGGVSTQYWIAMIQSGFVRLSRVTFACASSGGGVCTHGVEVSFGGQLELVDSVIQSPGPAVLFRSQPSYSSVPSILWMRGGTLDAPGGLGVVSPTNEITSFFGSGVQFTGSIVAQGAVAPATLKCVGCFNASFDPIAP